MHCCTAPSPLSSTTEAPKTFNSIRPTRRIFAYVSRADVVVIALRIGSAAVLKRIVNAGIINARIECASITIVAILRRSANSTAFIINRKVPAFQSINRRNEIGEINVVTKIDCADNPIVAVNIATLNRWLRIAAYPAYGLRLAHIIKTKRNPTWIRVHSLTFWIRLTRQAISKIRYRTIHATTIFTAYFVATVVKINTVRIFFAHLYIASRTRIYFILYVITFPAVTNIFCT